jgi:hypothetical protein
MFLRRFFVTRTTYAAISVVRFGQLGFNPQHQGHGFSLGSEFQTGLGAQNNGDFSPQIKRLEHETDLSISSSAQVNIAWRYISTPLYAFMTWCLKNHMGCVTFRLLQFIETISVI